MKKTSRRKKASKQAPKGNNFYRHPKYNWIASNTQLATFVGRASFPSLVTPKAYTGNSEDEDDAQNNENSARYQMDIVSTATEKDVKAFVKQMTPLAEGMAEYYNENSKVEIGKVKVLDDGNKLDTERYEQYEDAIYIQVRKSAPKDKQVPITCFKEVDGKAVAIDPSKIEAGMKVRAVVEPKLTSHGISYNCLAIFLIEDDGVRFAGGQPSVNTLLDLVGLSASEDDEDDEDEEFEDESEDEEEDEDDSEDDEDEEEDEGEDEDELEEDEDEDEEEDEDDLPASFTKAATKQTKSKAKPKAKAKKAATKSKKELSALDDL